MLLSSVAPILSLTVSVFGNQSLSPPQRKTVPGAYIFQFEDDEDHTEFNSMVGSEGKSRMNFDYELFKGVSVQLDDIENADEKSSKMASSRAIKNMWPVEIYELPEDNIAWTGTPSKDTNSLFKRTDSSNGRYSTHEMTQIDRLHAEGYTGQGVKIAVIDTGVDYNHPVLGGCLGEGCVVTRGYNLVDDNSDDPMDCHGHGTHVTGILAAQENEFGFIGAAPDAEIWMYKVFGCEGGAPNDVLVAAVYQAFEDGADIISASLSVTSGWSDEFLSVAAASVVKQGTPCVFGAGNEGHVGMWRAGSAAAGDGVAGVGSVENTRIPTQQYLSKYAVDNQKESNFSYTPGFPEEWDDLQLPLWAAGDNACDAGPGDLPDLSDFIVLLQRSDCPVEETIISFIHAGAEYFFIYSKGEDVSPFYLDDVEGVKAVATISSEVASTWTKDLKDGAEINLSMTGPESADFIIVDFPNRETGGAMSPFSAWGPTWDLEEIKPSFSAPGGWILSTAPMGGFAVRSGTSMATPLVSGAYALVSQVRGTNDPEKLRTLFSANSDPLNFHDSKEDSDFLAPVPQQGGGIIRAYDAAFATTLLEPSQLSFGDKLNSRENLNFTLVNEGKKEVTYEIKNVPTVSVYTYSENSVYPTEFPNEVADKHVSLSFSDTKFSLSPGDSLTVGVVADDGNIDPGRLPVWSGWVTVNGTDGTSLSLPYQGVSGSLKEQTVLASDSAWISRSDHPDFKAVTDGFKFTLTRPGSVPETPPVIPVVAVLLAFGTSTLRADVVSLDEDSELPSKDFFGTETIGQVAAFPRRWLPRNGYPMPWTGMLDNGEYVPEGRYKIVMRALRIFGDPENGEDWDVAEAGTLQIAYA